MNPNSRRGSPRNGNGGQRGKYRSRSILRRERGDRTKRSISGFPRELFPPINPSCIVFPGQILVAETYQDAEEAVACLLEDLAEPHGYNLLGFDTEWKPNFGNGDDPPIAVVQLASRNTCVLFCLLKIGSMPDCLRGILTDESICKVGHTVDNNDAAKLLHQHGLLLQNVVDLKEIATNLDIRPVGLRALCNTILAKDLDKSMAVSDWASEQLTPEQVLYAASDAWVTREVYLRLAPPSLHMMPRPEFDCAVCGKALLNKTALVHHLRDKQHFDRLGPNGFHGVGAAMRMPAVFNNGFYPNGAAALSSSYPAAASFAGPFAPPSASVMYPGLPSVHATTHGLHANGLTSAPPSPKPKPAPPSPVLTDSRGSASSTDSSGSGVAPAAAAGSVELDSRILCRVCGRDFTSEKALSQHIRAKGHRQSAEERQSWVARSSESPSDDDVSDLSTDSYEDDGTVPASALAQDAAADDGDGADYDDSPRDDGAVEEIECRVCRRVFLSDDEFDRHRCSDPDPDASDAYTDDGGVESMGDSQRDESEEEGEGEYDEDELVACVVCNAEFASHQALTEHVRLTEHYSEPPDNGDGDIIVVCAVCGSQFSSTVSLNEHARSLSHYPDNERRGASSGAQPADAEEEDVADEEAYDDDDYAEDGEEDEAGDDGDDASAAEDDGYLYEGEDDEEDDSPETPAEPRTDEAEPSKHDDASPSAAAS